MTTHTFAHLSDVHIGAFRQPVLQKLAVKAFEEAMDNCISRQVDFIVIGGDLFDSNIPEMSLLNSAVKKIKEVRDNGIEIYVVYGNHDFSPTQTSIVDILESAGLFKKVTRGKVVDDKLQLEFVVDPKTNAKLCGISGRRLGIEKEYYNILDRDSLESEKGFKIFVFHGLIGPYKPDYLADAEAIPVSSLPKGFAYYAGGHIHEKFLGTDYGFTITYPGTLFGGDYRDIERSANGLERGFYIGTFDEQKLENIEFVPISVCSYEPLAYDANGLNVQNVQKELEKTVEKAEAKGKLVILKVFGELSSGRTSDIDFQKLAKQLRANGAIDVLLNYRGLSSREFANIRVTEDQGPQLEHRLFKENIGSVDATDPKLKGESGIKISEELLSKLRVSRKANEDAKGYGKRVVEEAISAMQLEEIFSSK